MAIYHLSIKVIQRSKGRTAPAAASYRAGVCLKDARTGEVHDYTRKRGVEHAELVFPHDVTMSREELWNAAEGAEKRKDARVAREFEIALPAELNEEHRRELAMGFARHLVEQYGVAADVALHEPSRKGDQRNHHAHILVTTRQISAQGLGNKTDLEQEDKALRAQGKDTGRQQIETLRAAWAAQCNRALQRAGHHERVSHKTLEAQGIDRQPTTHLGVAATAMERRGLQTERGDMNRAQEEREEVSQQIVKKPVEIELSESRRVDLACIRYVADRLFRGDVDTLLKQTGYPVRQCKGLLEDMQIAKPMPIAHLQEPLDDFCLLKQRTGERVSFQELSLYGVTATLEKHRRAVAVLKADEKRRVQVRLEQERAKLHRAEQKLLEDWKALGVPRYTEDEKRHVRYFESLLPHQRHVLDARLEDYSKELFHSVVEQEKAERGFSGWSERKDKVQAQLASLGMLKGFFTRAQLEAELKEATEQKDLHQQNLDKKNKKLNEDRKKVFFYTEAKKGREAIRARAVEAKERQERALTPEIKRALEREEAHQRRLKKEREQLQLQELKRQRERERDGWSR